MKQKNHTTTEQKQVYNFLFFKLNVIKSEILIFGHLQHLASRRNARLAPAEKEVTVCSPLNQTKKSGSTVGGVT